MKAFCKQHGTPEWFYRGAVYQINPRTFSSRGTIATVTEELPFLSSLGFKVMYFCPIFREDDSMENWSARQIKSATGNPKNPYRMTDYYDIDEEYGSMDDLRSFVKEAHRLGMKVMLDLVYLHAGKNAEFLKAYPDFAKRDENGELLLTQWNFPILNYENAGLREYLLSNMVYYVGAIGVDGFRCDVGDKVPLDFWKEGKRRIRAIKPDAVLLNEGSDWSYLEEAFDASYCFDWHTAIYEVVRGRMTADAIRACHENVRSGLPEGAILMRDIDNHDTVTDWSVRVENAAGHEGMELIEVLNYMIDGVPMVYCGNELGDTARLSMFANRFHKGSFDVTDRSIKTEAYSLRRQEIIQSLNRMKAESDTLAYGSTRWIDHSAAAQVVSFVREYEGDRLLFIGNLSDASCTVTLDTEDFDNASPVLESANPPRLDGKGLSMPPYSYMVRHY